MAEKDIANFAGLVGITDAEKVAEFVKAVEDYTQSHVLRPDLELLRNWGRNAHDDNRIHFYGGYARDLGLGFETAPTQGTLIAAHAEQYVLGLVDIVKQFSPEFNLEYSRQGLDFRMPLYPPDKVADIPGDSLKWSLTAPSAEDKGLSFILSGLSEKGKAIIRSPERNGKDPNVFFRSIPREDSSRYLAPFIGGKDGLLIEKGYKIIDEEREEFYNLVGVEPKEEVSFMQVASLPTAALLEFSRRENDEPSGVYRSQNFVFHAPPKEGKFETRVKLASEPVVDRRGNITYSFKAIIMQDDKLVVSGDLVSQIVKKDN